MHSDFQINIFLSHRFLLSHFKIFLCWWRQRCWNRDIPKHIVCRIDTFISLSQKSPEMSLLIAKVASLYAGLQGPSFVPASGFAILSGVSPSCTVKAGPCPYSDSSQQRREAEHGGGIANVKPSAARGTCHFHSHPVVRTSWPIPSWGRLARGPATRWLSWKNGFCQQGVVALTSLYLYSVRVFFSLSCELGV